METLPKMPPLKIKFHGTWNVDLMRATVGQVETIFEYVGLWGFIEWLGALEHEGKPEFYRAARALYWLMIQQNPEDAEALGLTADSPADCGDFELMDFLTAVADALPDPAGTPGAAADKPKPRTRTASA